MIAQLQRNRAQVAQRKRAISDTLPAPIGGWNARDSVANMPPTDAVTLTNWWPTPTDVRLRGGYTRWLTGISGQVETLMSYAGAATTKMFAAAGTAIYDATTTGAVGAAVVSGKTNARWQCQNITTAGGNYMYAVNGADSPLLYDGTNWTVITGVSVPAITGVTTSTFSDVLLHQNRLWFVQKNTLKIWYLPVISVGGAAAALDLSSVATLGGYIVSILSWTIDAGLGVDDHLVVVTSRGEVIVYRGNDPSSAGTFALVGVWQIGAPVGNRCLMKYAGDCLVVCQDGVYPLSGALQSSRTNPKVSITDKIQFAVSEAVTSYGSNFGWELLYYPKLNALWLNVPVAEGNNQQQFAMNTITRAWTQFTGWNANCWALFNDEPYFGANGFVGKAWAGNSDNAGAIAANALQAFNKFRHPALLKRVTMLRPIFQTNGSPAIQVGTNVDYNTTDTTSPLAYSGSATGAWGSGLWGSATWGVGLSLLNQWQGATGLGYAIAPRVKTTASGLEVIWSSTDIVMEPGAIL